MKRRLALISAAGAAMAATSPTSQATSHTKGRKERVVIQISTPDPKMWNQAINYLENLREIYGPDKVEMEVVALGLGLGVLTLDSPQGPRVADALKLGVHINACQTTMTRRKLTKEDMLPNIGIVPGGLVQIIKRQREGWAYIGT